MRRGGSGLAAASLLAGLGLAAASPAGKAADDRQRAKGRPHHSQAQGAPPAAATAPQQTENLVVHGQKRFQPAPVPNLAIHDPADAMRDPATGAALGRFGGAYNAANPIRPINPGLQNGDQSPVTEGVQR